MAVESTIKPNGFKTAWDTLVAPKEALETLRVAPTWGWAFLIVVVLGMLGLYLITPANVHATIANYPSQIAKSPQLQAMSPEQQQAGLTFATRIVSFVWIFTPVIYVIGALIATVVIFIFDKIGRGSGSFGKYWAAQWNISLINAIGGIVVAIIVLARGADSFTDPAQVTGAVPNLGMLVPASAVKLHAFLATFTPFTLWSTALEIAALRIIGRVGVVPAWIGGALILLVSGVLASAFVR